VVLRVKVATNSSDVASVIRLSKLDLLYCRPPSGCMIPMARATCEGCRAIDVRRCHLKVCCAWTTLLACLGLGRRADIWQVLASRTAARAVLLVALNQHRGKGQQKVTVVGTEPPWGGGSPKLKDQPPAKQIAYAPDRRCGARTRQGAERGQGKGGGASRPRCRTARRKAAGRAELVVHRPFFAAPIGRTAWDHSLVGLGVARQRPRRPRARCASRLHRQVQRRTSSAPTSVRR
jgi:hypothetical protein